MLRTYLALSLLLFTISSAAQTASDLTARYGYPDAERFVVGPEITMMAKYAANRSVCEMLIEPKRSIEQSDYKEQGMATGAVSKIIDELIPVTKRGIPLGGAIDSVGAPQAQVTIYQNVKISRYFVRYLPAHRDETSATVVRKDGLCGWPTAPQKYVPVVALNATDLHSRYGEPDRERFLPRPNIALTVEYGPDHMVCGALLAPPTTQPLLTQQVPETTKRRANQLELFIGGEEPPQYMTSDAVSEILEQLTPTASRGEKLRSGMTVSGCNQISFTEYANVSIMRSTHNCYPEQPDRDIRASVRYQRDECRNETLGRYH